MGWFLLLNVDNTGHEQPPFLWIVILRNASNQIQKDKIWRMKMYNDSAVLFENSKHVSVFCWRKWALMMIQEEVL